MYDVIADQEGFSTAVGVRVLDGWSVDLEGYAEAELTDAELLAHAHLELLTVQAAGVAVLGSTAPVVPVGNPLDGVPAEADVQMAACERAEVALAAVPNTRRRDELEIRRERRAAARVLRSLGGVA